MGNNDILVILEHLEREKGINKDVLLNTIEAALLTAARKRFGSDKDIKVKVDGETGHFKVFSGNKEITPKNFGRIAAQTARQVIIQKIREAEKEVVYEDFKDKESSVVTGFIQREEYKNKIVDLGNAEGILPFREQIKGESYQPRERVKFFLLEVKKTSKGPQLILSRTHPNFVKALFELEVPEIMDGIVEIKAIAREPGERTKIAVFSKQENVDPVGACVGVRGNRIKSIVRELKGEKIDIIRWSDNMEAYLTAALSPAKISRVNVDPENKRAEIIVPDDQLSLSIGKKGQNVRIAVKLTGWKIDIKTESNLAKEKTKEESKQESELSPLTLPGIGEKVLEKLKAAGFESLDKLLKAHVNDLIAVPGIGKKTVEKILAAIKKTD